MRLSKEERETLVSAIVLLISLFFFFSVFWIPHREILQSPRLMPHIITSIMVLLSIVYFIRSARQGVPNPAKIAGSFKGVLASSQWRNIFVSIAMISLFIFLGIPFLGFYISSFIFMSVVIIYFLRSLHFLLSILISLCLTAALYGIFQVAFMLNI